MSTPRSFFELTPLVVVIELIGALIIVGYVLAAIVALVRTRNIEAARLLVIEGALTGLSVKVAATLLKTIELHDWQQILLFTTVLALRTLLKTIFNWERTRLQ